MPDRPPVSELALSRAWNAGAGGTVLTTTEGERVEIVYRGAWSHGLGPDFPDAMLVFPGGRLVTGAVEIHLVTSGWREHGHHLDPAYNQVVLHVVGRHDGVPTRRADGAHVPVVEIGFAEADDAAAALPWHLVGGAVCAADLAQRDPAAIAGILRALGDRRLATRAATYEAQLTAAPPGESLWAGLLDALGYRANREPMALLASRAPLRVLETTLIGVLSADRQGVATALLLGVGGFFPLAPRDAETAGLDPAAAARVEAAWATLAPRWQTDILPPTAWTTLRVRPNNHPVARLAAAAALVANAPGGLTAALLDPIRSGQDPVAALLATARAAGAPLGEDRAIAIAANVLVPLALALAEQSDDPALLDAAAGAWERLRPAASNETTRRATLQVTGGPSIRGLGERGMQGLIHLDRALCTPRRCFECPIAAAVIAPATDPGPAPAQ
jgi:hypothetical protein